MNDTLAILLLGFIQGLTEFLPISSSMHLVLLDQYVWAHDPSLDVAVHLGSLLAVMLVFWRKVKQLLNGLHDLGRRRITPAVKLLLLLILATLPVIIAGLALDRFGREYLHHPTIIGATSLGFGV
ncbi:MAG: undecaprenyl-diphosphatase, partial [Alphaproteobacteria bacterium]|nr:undecaprenyl-diphosphatase [Alphaproteobacteria bacterium]